MTNTKQANAKNKPAKPNSKGKGPAKKQFRKNRGTLLSILIILILLHAIGATVLAYVTLKDEYAESISWVLPVLTLVSLADIVAAIGMWFWKKWGIYLYAITRVIATAVHIVLTGSTLVVFYDLLPVAILGFVINLQSKQDLFE